MSKVSMRLDVDPWVIEKFIDVIESHNISLREEVTKFFKYFFDDLILLFDEENKTIEVRMK